ASADATAGPDGGRCTATAGAAANTRTSAGTSPRGQSEQGLRAAGGLGASRIDRRASADATAGPDGGRCTATAGAAANTRTSADTSARGQSEQGLRAAARLDAAARAATGANRNCRTAIACVAARPYTCAFTCTGS